MFSAERLRLDEADTGGVASQRWGPYLSERQWGTVREDYGSGGDTWSYFSREQARSRAYRWREDGLAAWSWAGDGDGDRHLVVVNLSGQSAQARIPLDWPDLPGRSWRLTDILGPSVFKRDGGKLASPGLFVGLRPWQFHLLALQ